MDMPTRDSTHCTEDIRAVLRGLQQTTIRGLEAGEFYRLDRLDPFAYLQRIPKWVPVISGYLRTLREQGESVVFVDVCGRTFLRQAEANYSFSLQPVESRWSPAEATPVQGDIFCRHDFPRFLKLIESRGHRPAWVTFEPVAGLQFYHLPSDSRLTVVHRRVVYERLSRHLEATVRLLRPGGYMLIGRAFQMMNTLEFLCSTPPEEYPEYLWVKGFCRKHRCSVQMDHNPYGPYWLIRKWLR